jgi:hypothetical protein
LLRVGLYQHTGISTRISTRVSTGLLAIAVSLMPAVALSTPARAQDSKQGGSANASSQEDKTPHTAQEHLERAEQYEKKAAEYHQEAAAHRKMLEDYSKTVARNPKEIGENTYIRKMRLHCERYIKAAEALAREAEEMAKFHRMRAKEMEGK